MPTRREWAGALLAMLAAGCSNEERIIPVGQPIHHDDVDYSVQRVDRPARVGGHSPAGQFVVVLFQVENRAARVNHAWTDDIAYLVDDQGRQYERDGAVNAGHGEPTTHITPAEVTEAATLVFDVAKDAREAYLKVRGETLIGDVLNFRLFARTRVRLF